MEKKPCRQRERDLVVFPWAGVVTHIPGTCDPELAARQIEEYLSEFEPHNVSMVATTADKAWQTAVVQFKGDIFGYMNSVALDGFFQRIDRGRQGWASAPLRDEVKQTGGTPSEWCLYGWMATKDDLIVDDELGLHLSNRGRLSTIAGVVEEVVQRSVTKAEIRALKEVGELENRAELWNTGQELVLRKEAKDLEPLMNTLITKLDGVREVLSSSSGSSSDEEALCIATSVLQTHGPSPGISFKHSPQFSSFGLVSENFDGRFGDESTLQLDRCASIGTGGSVIQDYSKMLRLKRDWGDALFRKFMTVLAENEASSTKGWGGKAVAWNIAENRKATLAEVIKGLEQVIEAKDAAKGTGIKEQRRTVFESGKLQPTKVLQLMEEELGRGLPTGEVNKEDLKRKNRLLEMTKHELERKGALIAEVKDQLSENIEQIRTFKEELQKKSSLIEAQKEELQSKDQDLEALREELKRKDNLINAKDLLIEARRNAIEKKDYLNKTLSLELKLKNHLLEAKREEVRRKDVLIRARGLDSVFSGDVKEPLLIEDEPNGLSHVFTAMMDADTDAERRYPKRTRN